MLAADKLLLQSNLKQRAIQLREKELNLFNDKCACCAAARALRTPPLPCRESRGGRRMPRPGVSRSHTQSPPSIPPPLQILTCPPHTRRHTRTHTRPHTQRPPIVSAKMDRPIRIPRRRLSPLPSCRRPSRSFNAVGTQSAVLAGFAMTSFAEIDLPHNAFYSQKVRDRSLRSSPTPNNPSPSRPRLHL